MWKRGINDCRPQPTTNRNGETFMADHSKLRTNHTYKASEYVNLSLKVQGRKSILLYWRSWPKWPSSWRACNVIHGFGKPQVMQNRSLEKEEKSKTYLETLNKGIMEVAWGVWSRYSSKQCHMSASFKFFSVFKNCSAFLGANLFKYEGIGSLIWA